MKDQTHARIGSLLAIGGSESTIPLLADSGSNILSSHFMSPSEESRKFESFRKSVALVIVTTRRRMLWRLHLRTRVRARSRFLHTSAIMRRIGRSYRNGVVVENRTTVRSICERRSTCLPTSEHSDLNDSASSTADRTRSDSRIGYDIWSSICFSSEAMTEFTVVVRGASQVSRRRRLN